MAAERRMVSYVCPSCGAEVDTDKYDDPEHKWKLMCFKHRCPVCGREYEVWRPDEEGREG